MKLKIKMPKIKAPAKIAKAINKATFFAKRHEGEILIALGAISGTAAIGATARGTLKAVEIKNQADQNLKDIEGVHDHPEEYFAHVDDDHYAYSDDDYQKDLATLKSETITGYIRAYVPAFGLYILSMVAIGAGTGILRKRNIALAAAYNGLQASFTEYRSRVADRWGSNVEKDIYDGKETIVDEEVVIDPETGEEKTVAKGTRTVYNVASPYARLFDKNNVYFEDDVNYNLMILNRVEAELNELLYDRGYLFLNEAYRHLGFEPTIAGQQTGWLRDGKHDGHVSLGITKQQLRDFVNGDTHDLWLDFNVDGCILDDIPADLIDRV